MLQARNPRQSLPSLPEYRHCIYLLVTPGANCPSDAQNISVITANRVHGINEWLLSLEEIPTTKSNLFSISSAFPFAFT